MSVNGSGLQAGSRGAFFQAGRPGGQFPAAGRAAPLAVLSSEALGAVGRQKRNFASAPQA
jgi:hypothetical protein